VVRRIVNGGKTPTNTGDAQYDIVIVGAGASGIAAAASLKSRKPGLEIAIIDPADIHYYQPGWTMVGGSIFEPEQTLYQGRRRSVRAGKQCSDPGWVLRCEIQPYDCLPGAEAGLEQDQRPGR